MLLMHAWPFGRKKAKAFKQVLREKTKHARYTLMLKKKKRERPNTLLTTSHTEVEKNPKSVSLNEVPVGSNLITCDACGQQPALKSPAAQ